MKKLNMMKDLLTKLQHETSLSCLVLNATNIYTLLTKSFFKF